MKLIIFIIGILSFSTSWGQYDSSIVEYSGGMHALIKHMLDCVSRGELNNSVARTSRNQIDSDRSYLAILTISKKGSITDFNLITVGDTTRRALIVDAIKTTDKKWINHSRKSQIVCLPIFIVNPTDNRKYPGLPNIQLTNFYKWTKSYPIIYPPEIIECYPSVS